MNTSKASTGRDARLEAQRAFHHFTCIIMGKIATTKESLGPGKVVELGVIARCEKPDQICQSFLTFEAQGSGIVAWFGYGRQMRPWSVQLAAATATF